MATFTYLRRAMNAFRGRLQSLALAMLMSPILAGATPDGTPFTATVTLGAFDIFVVESARLDAKQSVTLASELPSNKAKIVWLVAEGTYVTVGDLVAKFDPAPFEDELQTLERDYQDAQATLVQAEAELQIQIRQGRESNTRIQYQQKIARLKLKNLTQADRPLRLAAAQNELDSARNEYERNVREATMQRQLVAQGLANQNTLKEAIAHEQEASNSVKVAQQQQKLLQTITLPIEIKQAELEYDNKIRQLENNQQTILHKLAKQNAGLTRLKNQVAGLDAERTRASELLKKTLVHAPVSGFVVYKKISVMNERRKVQIGDSIWNRYGFMVIPDMSAIVAYVNIREHDIGKVAAGQTVRLSPEAYPGLKLTGTVDTVGTLVANSTATDNLFQVRISIDGVDPRLRPGMRARASILTHHFASVVHIPVEAVFYENGKASCFVWQDGHEYRQLIDLGESDAKYVIVNSGLKPGQHVLLTYPHETRLGESRL